MGFLPYVSYFQPSSSFSCLPLTFISLIIIFLLSLSPSASACLPGKSYHSPVCVIRSPTVSQSHEVVVVGVVSHGAFVSSCFAYFSHACSYWWASVFACVTTCFRVNFSHIIITQHSGGFIPPLSTWKIPQPKQTPHTSLTTSPALCVHTLMLLLTLPENKYKHTSARCTQTALCVINTSSKCQPRTTSHAPRQKLYVVSALNH